MADFTFSLDSTEVAIAPRLLLPAVEAYCRELFPTDAQVTCNYTRVQADIELGDNAHAFAIIDIDPGMNPNLTRLSGRFTVRGAAIRESDEPIVAAMAARLFDGVRDVVARRIREAALEQDGLQGIG